MATRPNTPHITKSERISSRIRFPTSEEEGALLNGAIAFDPALARQDSSDEGE
ncbi:MAG: hypothetical protein AB1589_36805 [Cyanobacteriota bacterium]